MARILRGKILRAIKFPKIEEKNFESRNIKKKKGGEKIRIPEKFENWGGKN